MMLRAGCEADFAELAKLHGLSFAEGWDEKAFRDLVASGALVLVACEGGTIQGFIMFRVAADEAEILTLAAAPAFRRKGLARALVRAAAERAFAAGASRMFLEVALGNLAACALYASLGYSQKGQRKAYYRPPGSPPEDALVLEACLPLSTLGKGDQVD